MKRILMLADAGSEHTEKWVLGLANSGFQIGLYSLSSPVYNWYASNPNIQFLKDQKAKSGSLLSKNFLSVLPHLKRVIKEFKPDVVHAHYATSYGLLARLSKFKPYFISAWGTDVMKFPDKNFVYKRILRKNLEQAAMVFATSETIKEYILKVCQVPVSVIPFGVDLNQFKPGPRLSQFEKDNFVVAAIKTLESLYCIDVIIDAFALLVNKYPSKKLQLLVVGTGSLLTKLKQQANDLGIEKNVLFTGRIDFSEVANYFNTADIFVNISEYESFGVSVIEASACELPVIVTDVGGLREVVDQNSTGIRIAVRDIHATFEAMEKLMNNENLRIEMGKQGRIKVQKYYDWQLNLQQMINAYSNLIQN
jgi:glycosyltransferase involved in cell wall biosynthesis